MESSNAVTYVRAVAHSRSFSAAADSLGLTQPALSARVKKVEDQLGAKLFDRNTNPLTITEAGKAYLETNDKIDILNRELALRISDLQDLKCGKLTIGGAGFFNATLLPSAIAKFSKLYPGVDIKVTTDTVPNLTRDAINGTLDLFITPFANKNLGLEYEELLTERVFLCLAKDHPLVKTLPPVGPEGFARISREDIQSLEDCPFVMLDSSLQIGRIMAEVLRSSSLKPRNIIRVDQTIVGLALAEQGVGICMLAESATKGAMSGQLALYLPDEDICTRTLYVARQKGASVSKAASMFTAILKESVR